VRSDAAEAFKAKGFVEVKPGEWVRPRRTKKDSQQALPLPPPQEGQRMRQSRAGLNKLETAWRDYVKALHPALLITEQAVRLRLANGLWYKPDFFAFAPGFKKPAVAWEVKGPHAFRGGFENLKMAATTYPTVQFILVWREGGAWKQQEVLP
jgi:hypothetical protein